MRLLFLLALFGTQLNAAFATDPRELKRMLDAFVNPSLRVQERLPITIILSPASFDRVPASYVPKLRDALRETDPIIRRTAVLLLGKTQSDAKPVVVTALKPAIDEPDLRPYAALAFVKVDKSVLNSALIYSITDLLSSSDDEIRRSAASALGELGSGAEVSIPKLINAVSDPNEWVRIDAVRSLGSVGGQTNRIPPNVISTLIAAIGDRDLRVAEEATSALEQFGEEAGPAVSELTSASRRIPELRISSVRVLGTIRRPAGPAVPTLISYLKDKATVISAAQALGMIGYPSKQAVQTLLVLAQRPRDQNEDSRDISRAAADAIGNISSSLQDVSDTSAIPILRNAYSILSTNPDRFVRQNAVKVRRSLDYLSLYESRITIAKVFTSIREHAVFVSIGFLYLSVTLVWPILYWSAPLKLLSVYWSLQAITEVKLPFGITLPLRQVLLLKAWVYRRRVLDAWVAKYVFVCRVAKRMTTQGLRLQRQVERLSGA